MSNDKSLDKTKMLDTAQTLARQFYNFLSRLGLDAQHYRLDFIILRNVVERYWRDVDRLHRYHATERIDRHKIAGYISYWICKLRPIAVTESDVYSNNAMIPLYINEIFAVSAAFGRICACDKNMSDDKVAVIEEKFFTSLMYSLRYRAMTGDTLSMMYYLIENKDKQ